MKYLIDTHVALWWWAAPEKLSHFCLETIQAKPQEIAFSSISTYEIFLKHRLGKLSLSKRIADTYFEILADEGWRTLPLDARSAHLAASYEVEHRDPFDRMLAAQAETHDLVLLTTDHAFQNFPIHVRW